MKGLEELPERVRRVGQPAVGQGVGDQQVAELVVNRGLRYSGENRNQGAGEKSQEPDQQKDDARASPENSKQEPAEKKAFGMVLAAGFLQSRISRISPTKARISKHGYILSNRTIFTRTNSSRPGSTLKQSPAKFADFRFGGFETSVCRFPEGMDGLFQNPRRRNILRHVFQMTQPSLESNAPGGNRAPGPPLELCVCLTLAILKNLF